MHASHQYHTILGLFILDEGKLGVGNQAWGVLDDRGCRFRSLRNVCIFQESL